MAGVPTVVPMQEVRLATVTWSPSARARKPAGKRPSLLDNLHVCGNTLDAPLSVRRERVEDPLVKTEQIRRCFHGWSRPLERREHGETAEAEGPVATASGETSSKGEC